ncbi:PREDICTED: protein FLUORESCENT IN BLUE LIGHT, chloroplastic-like isoform X1 [Nelumbo nucifera]|uniref:Protein FLUORESCENT IN BLUE LIGHT, chloroplastic-like isoform X1 n=1 Tax=Nelumbo nucifera TaxID=4432 RepID=A0A1U8AZY3_NELNU|nr:PREDICTED: protein FLUORESCENT IN BLUE LIGHT, chloroplastic-like isoform X1 [Nelumbo nucifera]
MAVFVFHCDCMSFRPYRPSPSAFPGVLVPSAKRGLKDILHVRMVKIFKHVMQEKALGKIDLSPTRGERSLCSFVNASCRTQTPIETRCTLPNCRSMYSGQMNKLKGICDTDHRLLGFSKVIVEHLFVHQITAPFNSPTTIFTVANILMLVMPFEALAETCEADNSVFNMPLLLFVALVGATVGGLLARQRRGELQRLNDQLRQINEALRRQAKIESYAPTLSYAPVGSRISENEIIVDSRKQELISRLKNGKKFLRNQDPQKAFTEFKTALELAQNLKDPIEEKKAARGLGASLQRQGKYREAIKYHSMVLAVSEREGEDSGNTEAYGAIADCYTELGDLERAGRFYDRYISRLQMD